MYWYECGVEWVYGIVLVVFGYFDLFGIWFEFWSNFYVLDVFGFLFEVDIEVEICGMGCYLVL